MKHQIEFEGGTITFNLLPTSAVFDISDAKGDAEDSAALAPDAQRKIAVLLDKYVLEVMVADEGALIDGSWDTISDTPLPWGMRAFEAMLDFSFGGATKDGTPSES